LPTITMPQLGETVTEGTITRWLKKVGDRVESDELLFEVSTDKVDSEVPSTTSGVLTEILVQEGETVPVGAPLCVIGERSAADTHGAALSAPPTPTPEPAAPPAPPTPTPEPEPAAPRPTPAPASRGGDQDGEQRSVLSPVVRKLVRENNVDLSQVRGTGAGGRITREDVLAHIEGKPVTERKPEAGPARPRPPSRPSGPPPGRSRAPGPAQVRQPSPGDQAHRRAETGVPTPPDERGAHTEPLSTIRQRIAEHMTRSRQVSAHVFSMIEVDMESVERVRSRHKDAFREREGFGLTYMPFISRAVVDALATYPAVNASVDLVQRSVTYHEYVNLGIAVDLDQKGLIVPVVGRADEMTVVGLARRIHELAEKAHSRQLSPDDVVGSTFTITNPGPFGSLMSAPVINQPNVAILSTESVEKRVVVVNDAIAIRHRMYLCMSWDHRAFDGSTAVKFLAVIKENLETWDWEAQLS
jgi:pyruvate dehydrogenase E2 component (dihydrolipoyllysine-residue acetyltransferase)